MENFNLDTVVYIPTFVSEWPFKMTVQNITIKKIEYNGKDEIRLSGRFFESGYNQYREINFSYYGDRLFSDHIRFTKEEILEDHKQRVIKKIQGYEDAIRELRLENYELLNNIK
jgi:hypothetical protein